jgi:hypothetical protein
MFIIIGIIAVILYVLLVKGWLWRGIIGIFAWVGMFLCLSSYIPQSHQTCITIITYPINWATMVPTLILLLGIITTKIKTK